MQNNRPSIRVRRYAGRARYDSDTTYAIIDEAWYCHVAFIRDGYPIIIPTLHVRLDHQLYIHGAGPTGLFKDLRKAPQVSVAITLLDGLVLARSVHNHSAQYRSVVIFGDAREVKDIGDKQRLFRALADKVAPGRWSDARQPNEKEVGMTRVFAIDLDHASAKVHQDPPEDPVEDLQRDTWAGVIPLSLTYGRPRQAPDQSSDVAFPEYLIARLQSWDVRT